MEVSGKRDYFADGQWNALCDQCGQKYKSSEMRKEEWSGLIVCGTCWEPRHPQERIRARKDDQTTEWARPRDVTFTRTELLSDPGFSDSSKWVAEAGWTVTGGQGVCATASTSLHSHEVNLAPNLTYTLALSVAVTSGSVKIFFQGDELVDISSTQNYSTTVTARVTNTRIRLLGSSFNGTVDDASLK